MFSFIILVINGTTKHHYINYIYVLSWCIKYGENKVIQDILGEGTKQGFKRMCIVYETLVSMVHVLIYAIMYILPYKFRYLLHFTFIFIDVT